MRLNARSIANCLIAAMSLALLACSSGLSEQTVADLAQIQREDFAVAVATSDMESYASADLPVDLLSAHVGELASVQADSYWIGSDMLDTALNPDHVQEYEELLGSGKTLAFIGLNDPNRVSALFGLPQEIQIGDSNPPNIIYLWQHEERTGEKRVAMGQFFGHGSATEPTTLKLALIQVWEHH